MIVEVCFFFPLFNFPVILSFYALVFGISCLFIFAFLEMLEKKVIAKTFKVSRHEAAF